MIIRTFDTLSPEEKNKFYDFCKEQSGEPAASNMWSLKHILEGNTRFDGQKGQFYILYDGETIAGCSGVYLSDFDKRIAFAGTRTWIAHAYRNQSLNKFYLLPIQKKWAIEKGCKQIALCFNIYNKNLIKIFFRTRLGENPDRVSIRTPDQLFYLNITELPFSVNIQDTEQWVIYEKLDPNWEFDWSLLTYESNI